jgi:glycosyltransferase involved in cell wall biosynthesis
METQDCRVVVQQPALRKYRIPFFQEWSGRDGISLKLQYALRGNELTADDINGFDSECVPMWVKRIGRKKLMWHAAQWRSAKQHMCDVLVLSWNVQYLSLVPALLRARKNGIKTILWGHGFSKQESGARKFLRDAVGRLADALVFYDYNTARAFLDAGWPEYKIHVAPNSLDQAAIQQARAYWLNPSGRLESFQQENGLAGRKNIIYVGRIYEENRLDLLLQALPELAQKHPTVQLLVIGSLNDTAGVLQQLAEKTGVSDRVKWLGAIYGEHDIAPYMLSSCLFCYPANIGLSIMHAMGYGVPVVTGDQTSSHNPEIHVLRNGVNGCEFKHLDIASLSIRLTELLDAPDRTAAMGSAARNAVLEEFTTPKMVDGFISALNCVLND